MKISKLSKIRKFSQKLLWIPLKRTCPHTLKHELCSIYARLTRLNWSETIKYILKKFSIRKTNYNKEKDGSIIRKLLFGFWIQKISEKKNEKLNDFIMGSGLDFEFLFFSHFIFKRPNSKKLLCWFLGWNFGVLKIPYFSTRIELFENFLGKYE